MSIESSEAKSTLLILSIIDEKTELASWLLSNSSCDVNCGVGDIEYPLTAAGRHPRALELLISHPELDKSVTNVSGETVLHIMATQNDPAALRKYLPLLRELLETKDSLGATALVRAVASKYHENARILLDNKARAEAMTNEGMNAAHIAACINDLAAFELILEINGGVINAQNSFGNTPLMEAALVVDQSDGDFLRFLKSASDNSADLTIRNKYGKTLLHLLAMKELPKALEVVKHSKININERDANGHTPLVDALLSGAILSTRFLLSSAVGEKIAFDKMNRTVGTVFHAAKNVDKRLEELQVAELGRDMRTAHPRKYPIRRKNQRQRQLYMLHKEEVLLNEITQPHYPTEHHFPDYEEEMQHPYSTRHLEANAKLGEAIEATEVYGPDNILLRKCEEAFQAT
ncbi:Oidioi.mRNA.OKI2018_I69.XSR.g16335.t2.cds [Oikopleura dioica]|uniref:Oidioi.mRNA.OKI2018_I69.XSR.g16335.t2.cds n=1 Tax=Oikopleura dioica TaxID=34765 RepID=A0ABN7SKN1_OIKDI|nr:Oidioi.mRNA.OKI2018_I69.XSR.g16335.t2.cds [Oikopleura dioica]